MIKISCLLDRHGYGYLQDKINKDYKEMQENFEINNYLMTHLKIDYLPRDVITSIILWYKY